MLTAGKEEPVIISLERMLAMRHYMRSKHVDGAPDKSILDNVGLTVDMVEDMYKYMAIANYEDRYVIPTGHKEETMDAYGERGSCGFSFGNGCSSGSNNDVDMFGGSRTSGGPSGAKKDNRINTLFTYGEIKQ